MSSIKNKAVLLAILFATLVPLRVEAGGSKSVTMTVGEKQTLYLPASVTSLDLKSCYFYAASPAYADINYYTNFSVKVEAKKPTPGAAVVIRCDYNYYVKNGNYTYEASGYYDFLITIVGKNPSSISLPVEQTVYVGEGKYLTPTIYPEDAYTELTWSSSAFSTINVDHNGKILAQSSGTSVITVSTQNGLKASCTVTAIRRTVDPTSISLSKSSLQLVVGHASTLTATVQPTDATDKSVTWYSQNSSIASVSSGKVTAKKEGQTIITAYTSNGLIATCKVTCVLPTLKITGDSELTNVPSTANVEFSRSFDKGWNSLCIPLGLTRAELEAASGLSGCKLATFKEIKGTRLVFEEVDAIDGGTPALIYIPEDTTISIRKDKVDLATSPKQISNIIGTYTTKTIGPGYYKLAPDGTSFGITTTEEATVKATRIYIQF